MTVEITLTLAGSDTGPFNLLSNVDGFVLPFEFSVSKVALEAGYVSILVPENTEVIRIQSNNPLCNNYIDVQITGLPTTTTTSTTAAPTTTTTTTAGAPTFYDHRRGNTPTMLICSSCPGSLGSGLLYTSPSDTIPTIGTRFYSESTLSVAFNGGNMWWAIEWDGPSVSSVDVVQIDTNGYITNFGICAVDCP